MFKRLITSLIAVGGVSATNAAQHTTAGCAKYGQPEFVFATDDAATIDGDIEWFKQTLVGMVAKGERFKAGETFLIGPVLLKITVDGDKLRLLEPDMKSMPFKYIDSVGSTLLMLRKQVDAVKSLEGSATPLFAPLHEPLLVEKGALKAEVLLLRRSGSLGTGWVIMDAGSTSSEAPDLEPMSVYEALLNRRDILDFLAMPARYSVAMRDRRNFAILEGEKRIQPIKDSYLDMLGRKP